MRPVVLWSAAYALIARFVWMQLLPHRGLGTDSLAACNVRADLQAEGFAAVALLGYALLTFLYWRKQRSGVR